MQEQIARLAIMMQWAMLTLFQTKISLHFSMLTEKYRLEIPFIGSHLKAHSIIVNIMPIMRELISIHYAYYLE
ncbi:hypothetical protein C8N47_108109 [Mangrovibacterium marinum]|uniref:Uncharacterized protein n=1 Tax=Mangrovibacterium marinum TaxID=1639118 RepID=A0A2T5C1R3_9BACT|nr:hypothetical protein C8N47_108109 [Mangrovibacterium marinum]